MEHLFNVSLSFNMTAIMNTAESMTEMILILPLAFALYITLWGVICLAAPLTLLAICALLFVVHKDNVAPIFVINLLISDLIQFCCMIFMVVRPRIYLLRYVFLLHLVSLTASIGFMMSVAVERYLVVAWPVWYRFRRSIKVSVMVWLFPQVSVTLGLFIYFSTDLIFAIFFLLPFPVFVFSLVGTVKSLSGVTSVSPEEKQRIAGTLVLVLFNYTVFYLPYLISVIMLTLTKTLNFPFLVIAVFVIFISPVADLFLYFFLGKGATEKLLAFLCCCRKDTQHGVL